MRIRTVALSRERVSARGFFHLFFSEIFLRPIKVLRKHCCTRNSQKKVKITSVIQFSFGWQTLDLHIVSFCNKYSSVNVLRKPERSTELFELFLMLSR